MSEANLRHFCAAVAVGLMMGAIQTTAAESTGAPLTETARVYIQPVETHPSQGDVRPVEGARARLTTTPLGAYLRFHTTELMAGHAYTLCWDVVNEPDRCESSPCTPSDVLKRTAETKADVVYDVVYGDGLIASPHLRQWRTAVKALPPKSG